MAFVFLLSQSLKLPHSELYNAFSSFHKLINFVFSPSLHSRLLEHFLSLAVVLDCAAGFNRRPLLPDEMAGVNNNAVFQGIFSFISWNYYTSGIEVEVFDWVCRPIKIIQIKKPLILRIYSITIIICYLPLYVHDVFRTLQV